MTQLDTRVERFQPARAPGWQRFLFQGEQDAKLVVFCVATLTLFRAVLLFAQRRAMSPESGWSDVSAVFLNALRFDGKIGAIVALPSFLGSLACLAGDFRITAERVRRLLGTLFVAVTVPLCAIDFGYFREFHAQFDRFVLGAVYDDLGAVVRTVWKSSPVIPSLLSLLILTAAGSFLLRRMLSRSWIPIGIFERQTATVGFRTVSVSSAIVLFALTLRGSATSRPVQEHDAAVTQDPFLNELVPNPYLALDYALGEWSTLRSAAGLEVHLKDGDVRAAAVRIAGPGAGLRDLDEALLRRAPGPGRLPRRAPRHVVLVIMESYDAWTLTDPWAELHLADEMKSLGREGILLDRFVSASSGTMGSLASIITGLADAGVYTNYQPSAGQPYPSSIAPIFRRLGFRTRVFYGGYLSWQRIGDFCRDQGFEEVYGAPHMGAWAHTNEWGVDDEALFSFVDRTLVDDVPSFDLVLTTSNHPPYDIDVWAKGWPVRETPPGLAAGFAEGTVTLREIGHHAYADRAMGGFLRRVSARLPSALFAVTGDHYSRKFPGARPTLYERTAVPLLLYGRAALEGVVAPPDCVGSHLDIAPTLIDLAAPAGFEYDAIGSDLLAPRARQLGIGPVGRVIAPHWIADLRGAPVWEPLPGRGPLEAPPDLPEARTARDAVLGVAWWRIMRGPEWPAHSHETR